MSFQSDSILDKDLYELFGVLQDASVKDIKTAYRKKALECHPDKNPDNPRANELFLELSRALSVLIDQSARAAYDKLFNAKSAAKKRHQQLDSKRKKFKEDLDQKERKAEQTNSSFNIKASQEKFQKELDRLRKMSHQQVEEELNYVRNLMKERKACNDHLKTDTVFRLKVKWGTDSSHNLTSDDYTAEAIRSIFSKYGCVSTIAMLLKRKGSAIVEFSDKKAAINAFKLEKGNVNNPLTISWIGTPPEVDSRDSNNIFNAKAFKTNTDETKLEANQVDDDTDDFETAVLRKLKEAEQRKNENL